MTVAELFDIRGRTALVTGGAGLYGRHIVEALLDAGCRVAVASRNVENLKALRDSIPGAGEESMPCFSFDQGDTSSIDELVDSVYNELQELDILVNNAVLRPMRTFHDDIARFDESMRVNATGLFDLTRKTADRMASRGSGSVINIASIQGVVGVDLTLYEGTEMTSSIPDYYFHKGGLINLTRMLASQYGRYGVRINAVSPGGLYNDHDPVFVKRYCARTFLGRMAGADDIKGVIVFLASDASGYVTGENIMLDGGYVQK